MDSVGTLIDRLLKQQGMTQIELSKRSGIAPSHISLIIAGKCSITTQSAVLLAKGLGIITAREILNYQIDYNLHQFHQNTHTEESLVSMPG